MNTGLYFLLAAIVILAADIIIGVSMLGFMAADMIPFGPPPAALLWVIVVAFFVGLCGIGITIWSER